MLTSLFLGMKQSAKKLSNRYLQAIFRFVSYLSLAGLVFAPLPVGALTYSEVLTQSNKTNQPQVLAESTGQACMPTGKQWYVSTTGNPTTGDGSFSNPWNLQTALKHAGPSAGIKPGDAVCIRGGVYNNANSKFENGEYLVAQLRGTKEAPIVVRSYPGERVTIDLGNSAFYIGGNTWDGTTADLNKGHDMWLWGLEIMSSVSPHSDGTPCGGSTGNHCSWTALYSFVDIRGPRTKIINCILHDMSTGISSWRFAYEVDVYGTTIFHNGWVGPDRGHGHGFYIENLRDRQYRAKEMEDNIVFENASNNIQAYAGGAEVANMKFLGNTLFNAGYLSGSYDYNFLVGSGSGPKQDFYIKDNMTYSTNDDSMTSFGWNWDYVNNNATVDNNYLMGGAIASGMYNWYQGVFTNNTVYAGKGVTTQLNNFIDAGINQSASGYVWNNNTYYGNNAFRISYNTTADRNYNGAVHGDTRDFNFWKTATGFDKNSTYISSAPTGLKVFVRPNKYEPGRANITVYNWDLKPTVSIDLSQSGIKPGDAYKIIDAQNINGDPIASGTYTGAPVSVSMTNLQKMQIRGGRTIAHTAPKFGIFILLSGQAINGLSTSIPTPTPTPTPAPTPTPTPAPTPTPTPAPVPGAPMVVNSFTASSNQIANGGSITLSWNVSDAATGGGLVLTGSDGLNGGAQPLIKTTGSITPNVTNGTVTYTLTPTSGNPATVTVTVGTPGAVTTPTPQPTVPPATGSLLMQTYNLNNFIPNNPVYDGQWQGVKYASDGNLYFGSSSHDARHGAGFFKFDPRTGKLTMLTEDLTKVVGENPLTTPQGKLHSDILESNGWLYFATYFGNEGGYYSQYSGSHIIGYNLASGQFKDFGIAKANYTIYSAIGMDPTGRYIYGFWTGRLDGQGSYLYRLDIQTGAYTNLGYLGGPASSFYMFVDQNGFVWFSVEYIGGTLFRYNPNTNQIERYNNELPQIYVAGTGSTPSYLGSATDQSYRRIQWMQPIDGNRALFTMGYNGGRLYMLDATKQPGSGAEFSVIKDIGYTDLGLAVAENSKRVFYYQRANRGCGHQADGQNQGFCGKPSTELKDFHLMSVSYDPATNYAITDHGLLVDQNGRSSWRMPGMDTDGNNKVFGVGDWFTIAGDIGSKNSYRPAGVNRSEFLAYTDVSGASVLPITLANAPTPTPTPTPTPDTTAPTISAISSSNISQTGATITWTTNEASDSQVEYGSNANYGLATTLNTSSVNAHSVGLSGLSANTLYHFRVKSRDSAGNLAVSANGTFTTLTNVVVPSDTTAPAISAISSSNISQTGATITWTTNELADTQVEYGSTTSYGSATTLNSSAITSHSAVLSGLTANTLYHFRVKSSDVAGNLAVSADVTFTTLATPMPAPTPGDKKNRKPIGFVDGVKTDGTVFGWALDPDSPAQSVSVHFYLNAPAGSPNTTPIGTNASQQRSDIGSHAFNFKVPDSYFDGNPHKVYVYAIDLTDTSGAANRLLLGAPKSFTLANLISPITPTTTPVTVPSTTPVTIPPVVPTTTTATSLPSPLAYWTFDSTELSAGTVSDKSGNNISLNVNNTTASAGKVGQALSFNGTNSNLQAYNNSLNLNSDLSFSFWVKTTTTRTEAILSKYDSSGSESGYMLKINNGYLETQIGNANLAVYGGRTSTDIKKINDGAWHHVAVVIGLGKDVRFYVDGLLSSVGNSVTKAGSLASPFQIGSEPFGFYGSYFNGSLDEVRVYNQSLSLAEIQAVLALGLGQVKGEYKNINFGEAGSGSMGESGKLYQLEGSKTVYLILSDNTKYAFKSAAEFKNFGYKYELIIKVPTRAKEYFLSTFADSSLNKLQSHPNGTFVKYAGKPAVYLIENGYKRAVPSVEVLKQYTDFTHVLTIPKVFVYADGAILK